MAKRSAFMLFMNTTPGSSSTYHLVGDGVTDLSISYNPQSKTEQFINQDTASTEITGYQPNAPVTMQVKNTDPVFTFINGIRKARAVGDDANTDIVTVDAFQDAVSGAYAAEKQNVSIQIDSFGGPATDPLSINFTINYKGDPVPGTFNTSTKSFEAES